jgi:hypothetical protein
MIWNIIDHRKRPYRWKAITAIMEPTYHDNSVADSDQVEDIVFDTFYDQRAEISLADAVTWVQSLPFPATLYLYDLGDGIRVSASNETEHFGEMGPDSSKLYHQFPHLGDWRYHGGG